MGQNCDCLASSIACVKTVTAAPLARLKRGKHAKACGHTTEEVKIKKGKEENVTLFLHPVCNLIKDAT